MSSKRLQRRQTLKLNEILDALEADDDIPFPKAVSILPPENANAEVTDEDSGDEDFVNIQNLPGAQLRAQAEVAYDELSSEDEEYDIPLSRLAKRKRFVESPIQSQSPDNSLRNISSSSPIPSTSSASDGTVAPTVARNQNYKWRNHHKPNCYPEWKEVQAPNNMQPPIYYFDTMFDDNVIQLLVHYTNLYASQKNKPSTVTVNEMKCFLGILLYSGYVVVPRRSMYWEKSADTQFSLFSYIYNAMSRDRFNFIMSHIHCCDNTEVVASDDKFSKLRPLFDLLNRNYIAMAPLEESYSIDEAMVPYYGGHSCKQFIRGKPIRWGYKLWVGATRLGYVLWFDPYQGHAGTIPPAYKQFGLGWSVIIRFADILQSRQPDLHFHLFFDNFFSSIPLFHELGSRGLKGTGTVRDNRTSKCPLTSNSDFKKTERGTFQFKSSNPGNILVCKWNDNSVVIVASNVDTVEPLHKTKRFSQQVKKYVQIDQPDIIKKYNENMGGVDRSDQNIGLYRTSIRGKKLYFPLIAHCLDMSVHNAWQLYKHDKGDYDHLSFRRAIARSLLETYKSDGKRGPSRTPASYRETSRYDKIDHLIEYKENQLRCTLCKKKTNFFCKKCDVHLHPKSCFVTYHTN